MFIPEPNGSSFTPPPAGSHVAICYRFIDYGTQQVEWKGTTKLQRKVLLGWELPNEVMEDGKPFTISRKYTWSMSEKSNLRHDLEAWRGKAFTTDDFTGPTRFNIKNILGKACLLSVVHETRDGNTYANLMGVSALPKGMPVPSLTNEIAYLALEKHLFDQHVFDKLSDKMKETIRSSPEFKALFDPNAGEPQPDDDGRVYDDELSDPVPF